METPAGEDSPWKQELAAIVAARHGGAVESTLPRLHALDGRNPGNSEILFQLAWTCDLLGRERDAVDFYESAVALGLSKARLPGTLLGLGSTLRCLGEHGRAERVLRDGTSKFPR